MDTKSIHHKILMLILHSIYVDQSQDITVVTTIAVFLNSSEVVS